MDLTTTLNCGRSVHDRTDLRQRRVSAILALFLLTLTACNSTDDTTGAYDAVNRNDCLPAIKLIDQNGHEFMLSSLKGKPVVIDFIYTSCPGPCITLTQKMANIAQKLGGDVGEKAAPSPVSRLLKIWRMRSGVMVLLLVSVCVR